MACEAQYQQYLQTRSATDKKIYDDCLNRASANAAEQRSYAAQQAEADRTAALYSQIHATSAQLAQQNQLPTSSPNYLQYLQSGAQYTAPSGPGFLSRTTSGIGQGILIFGILAGGMAVMLLMFYMVKPKTVQQIPGFKRKRK